MQGMDLTISGHKGWVEYIKGQPKLEPWYKEPYLIVFISIHSPLPVSGFSIRLPLKDYTRDELKQKIDEEGSRRFNEIIIEQAEEKKKRAAAQAEKTAAQDIARKVSEAAGVELLEDDKSAGIPGVIDRILL